MPRPIRRPRADRSRARFNHPALPEPLESRRLLSATLLKDINTANGDAAPYGLANIDGTLYFGATTPDAGNTGLSTPDVFAFGNVIGDTGDDAHTSAIDLATVRRSLNRDAGIDSLIDPNHDGQTNALDLAIVKRNLNRFLFLPPSIVPAPTPPAPGGATEMVREA